MCARYQIFLFFWVVPQILAQYGNNSECRDTSVAAKSEDCEVCPPCSDARVSKALTHVTQSMTMLQLNVNRARLDAIDEDYDATESHDDDLLLAEFVETPAHITISGRLLTRARGWRALLHSDPPALSQWELCICLALVSMSVPFYFKFCGAMPSILDVRSLGIGRVLCGLALLVNLWERSEPVEVRLLYSDNGFHPCKLAKDYNFIALQQCRLGIPVNSMFFSTGLIFAAFVTIGFCTQTATFCSWLMVLVLDQRNTEAATSCGDSLLLMVFFWGNFVPWGRSFSLDAAVQKPYSESLPDYGVRSPGAVGFSAQVAIAFLGAGSIKTGPEWVGPDLTAVSLAAHIISWSRPPMTFLRLCPRLCRILTQLTIALELYGPWLLLIPLTQHRLAQYARLFGLVLFIGFMTSIGSCIELGVIPLIFNAALICLLPPLVWGKPATRQDNHDVMVTAGCADLVTAAKTAKSGASSPTNATATASAHSSTERYGVESSCGKSVLKGLPIVASILKQAVALSAVICMVLDAGGYDLPQYFAAVAETITKQRGSWNMFDHGIEHYDVWVAFRGTLSDGSVVDIGDDNGVVSFGQGFNVSDYLVAYIFNLQRSQSKQMASYICRVWNDPSRLTNCKRKCPKLKSLEVVEIEDTTIVGEDKLHFTKSGPREVSSAGYRCR